MINVMNCRFCGSHMEVEKAPDFMRIECRNPLCSKQPMILMRTEGHTEEDIIKRWNEMMEE